MIDTFMRHLTRAFSFASVRKLLSPPVLVAVMLISGIVAHYIAKNQKIQLVSKRGLVYLIAIFCLISIGYMLIIKFRGLGDKTDSDEEFLLRSYDLKDYFLPMMPMLGKGTKLVGKFLGRKKKKRARKKAKRMARRMPQVENYENNFNNNVNENPGFFRGWGRNEIPRFLMNEGEVPDDEEEY